MRETNLERIAKMIGENKALALASAVAPTKSGELVIYIPPKPTPRFHLTKIIGDEAAQILCDNLGGSQITIERPARYATRQLVRKLLEDPRISIPEIAQIAGCSRKQVYVLWG